MNIKSKGLKKALTLMLLSVVTVGSVFSTNSIETHAHNAYYISIAIDEGRLQYVPTVIFEEVGWGSNSHRENDLGDFAEKTVGDNSQVKDFNIPSSIDYSQDEDKIKDNYKEFVTSGSKSLVFSFPGVHSNLFMEKRQANGKDEEIAYFVAERLVASFNDTMGWMMGLGGVKNTMKIEEFKNKSATLANKVNDVARGKLASGSITIGSETFTIKKLTDSKLMPESDKTTIADYVYITSSKGDSNVALVKVNKGYQTRDDITDSYKASLKSYKDPQYINWQYVVLQGNYAADVKLITYSNIGEIIKPNAMELLLSGLIGALVSGLRTLLGFYELPDIFFNTGSRSLTYYYGVMPKNWMSSARLLNFVCLIIALTVIGFAIVKLIAKKQLSTINVSERISLLEGFKDILVTVFSIGGFYLIFGTLVRVNYYLVDVFRASSNFSSSIGDVSSMNAGYLAAALLNAAFFIITAYYNIAYTLRAFTLAGLYAIAPLAIVSIAFGGKYKTIYSNFMNLLIGNIFMQSIQAIAVALFTSITATNNLKTFELLTILVAFIPFTNMIRQNIFGLSGGITDQAGGILSAGKSMVSGAVGGMVGGTIAKGGGGGGSSSGKSGGGGGSSVKDKATSPINSPNVAGKMKDMANGTPQTKDTKDGLLEGQNRQLGGNAQRALDIAKNTATGAIKAGAGVAAIGAATGFAATGDMSGVNQMANLGKDFIGSAGKSSSNVMSAIGNKELKQSGTKELYQGKESSTAIMDDKHGKFNDSSLNNTKYEEKFNQMRDAFLGQGAYGAGGALEGKRDEAIDHFKSKGIEDIKETNGQTAIKFSNDKYNDRNFNLKDIILHDEF